MTDQADPAARDRALAVDSVAAYRRAVADNDRGRAGWAGPTPAGDGDPDQADVVWLASMDRGAAAHRWGPGACTAPVRRRGGWTMPYGKARDWLDVTRCPYCWPAT